MKDIKNLKNDQESDIKSISKRRRNFAKAGVVAPVFLTLLNRPAWGAVRTMCAVSGFDSGMIKGGGMLSGVNTTMEECSGVHAEGYWNGKIPELHKSSKFNAFFNPTPLLGSLDTTDPTYDPTFAYVLANKDIFPRAFKFVGLFLDADSALENFPLGSTADVINIYNNDLSFFADQDWTSQNVDEFIDYLLANGLSV